jgi:F0F1-type ATP synthase beta subunit
VAEQFTGMSGQYVPLDKFNSVLEKLNEALERELVASGKLMKILAQLK